MNLFINVVDGDGYRKNVVSKHTMIIIILSISDNLNYKERDFSYTHITTVLRGFELRN